MILLKYGNSKSAIIYFWWTLIIVFASIVVSIDVEDAENIVPVPHYRSPKNIAFGSIGGESSHHLWVFEILEELYNRGHQISFYSRGDQHRFAKDYPISTKEVGGFNSFLSHPIMVKLLSAHPKLEHIAISAMEVSMLNYTDEFGDFTKQFKENNISLVICDSFAISCIDSAIYSKIPVIITSTFAISADSSAPYVNNKLYDSVVPTRKHESLWTKIYRNYFIVPRLIWATSQRLKEPFAFQRSLGFKNTMDASSPRFNNVPKLHSNVFGIEVSRRISPLVNLVGPVLRKSYPPLDPTTRNFLNAHKKVVYIAFGQNVYASVQDIEMIMHGLLQLLEEGIIDGVVWSRFEKEKIPSTIQTSKQLYSNQDIMNHPHIYLTGWAPQFAILQHPSIELFISHGGVTSMHEALYCGVRLFIFPFFGDQHANARSAKDIGIADYVDKLDLKDDATTRHELFFERLNNVAVDPENTIQNNVNRYRAYIQISATSSVRKGADVLEESLFASDADGELYYRKDVGYSIHWFKRNNYDIYTVLVAFNLLVLAATLAVWSRLWNSFANKSMKL